MLTQESNFSEWEKRGWLKSKNLLVESLAEAKFCNTQINLNNNSPNELKNLKQSLLSRKSLRSFEVRSNITKELFTEILKYSFKNINSIEHTDKFKILTICFKVKDLSNGIYKYNPSTSTLSLIKTGNYEKQVCEILSGMSTALTSVFSVFICTDYDVMLKDRKSNAIHLRQMFFELGYWMQRLIIKCSDNKLQGTVTPAISDKNAINFLQLNDTNLIPTYSATIGLESE